MATHITKTKVIHRLIHTHTYIHLFIRALLASLGALPKTKVPAPMVLNTVAPAIASTATNALSAVSAESAQTAATEQATASMESLVQDAVDGAFARIRDEL